MKNKLIVVAGPTAVGKTQYAIDLAKKVDGEIVSLDSVQVYKHLDIGSAKPTKEEMQGIPHYMIDEIEPSVNFNVKEFKDKVEKYINIIYGKKKMPILVGGTGFYIRAVVYDTDFLEEDANEAKTIRDDLYEKLRIKGIGYLLDELKEVDSESANSIPIENERRIIRALEFYRLHNFPISEHNKREREKESKYDVDFYVLTMDRDILYDRINKRVDMMIESGLLKEVKSLINMGLDKECNSMRSIGYSELYDFCKCRNEINDIKYLDEESKNELKVLIELIKQHSRNYAKRQLTWFKTEKNITWVNR